MRSIEIFSGAGGLALGCADAGFEHEAVIEINRNACETIRLNAAREVRPVLEWVLHETDVTSFNFTPYAGIDLLAGGPPCQPFSVGGKAQGHVDHRNMFPEVVRAVRQTQPRAILIENVKGLLRPRFANYFEYIVLQLAYPDVAQEKVEPWEQHLARLEQHHTSGSQKGLTYRVVWHCMNAANYGVPQRRERVFFVAFRSDINVEWSFPEVTHSQDKLLHSQWVTGEYWDEHKVSKRQRPTLSPVTAKRIERLRDHQSTLERWRTVRDAIHDLPDPTKRHSQDVPNHTHNPGARVYAGHTGSPMDEAAKTLKAGDHGVPGGENMLALNNGAVRYFTTRECARLQTFPDSFLFSGSWTEIMRQLGNAVPVSLARTIAESIAKELTRTSPHHGRKRTARRGSCTARPN